MLWKHSPCCDVTVPWGADWLCNLYLPRQGLTQRCSTNPRRVDPPMSSIQPGSATSTPSLPLDYFQETQDTLAKSWQSDWLEVSKTAGKPWNLGNCMSGKTSTLSYLIPWGTLRCSCAPPLQNSFWNTSGLTGHHLPKVTCKKMESTMSMTYK